MTEPLSREALVAELYDFGGLSSTDMKTAGLIARAARMLKADGEAKPDICNFYEREFYPLSNFSAFNLMWRGVLYTTSEAAYQASKFSDPTLQEIIRAAASAHAAFKLAENLKHCRKPNWDSVKVDIMRDILTAKAGQHEYVRRKLMETGDRELVECSWRDDFWGWGPNRDGQNMLGKLWMEVRAALTAQDTEGRGALI